MLEAWRAKGRANEVNTMVHALSMFFKSMFLWLTAESYKEDRWSILLCVKIHRLAFVSFEGLSSLPLPLYRLGSNASLWSTILDDTGVVE